MKLSDDFIDRLKKALLSKGCEQIVFDLDVFDDMDEDEYLVFKTIFNRYYAEHRTGNEEDID